MTYREKVAAALDAIAELVDGFAAAVEGGDIDLGVLEGFDYLFLGAHLVDQDLLDDRKWKLHEAAEDAHDAFLAADKQLLELASVPLSSTLLALLLDVHEREWAAEDAAIEDDLAAIERTTPVYLEGAEPPAPYRELEEAGMVELTEEEASDDEGGRVWMVALTAVGRRRVELTKLEAEVVALDRSAQDRRSPPRRLH